MSTKSCTKHIKMEEQLLVPKEEVFEELEVTLEPDCNNKELIVPKDEFSNTSPHSDTASDQQMCKPIKTETILSNEIVELQKVIKSSEDTEVSAGCLRTHIKWKPSEDEASLTADTAHTLGTRVQKRCVQRRRDRAAEKKKRYCCNVCDKTCKSKSVLHVHMRTHTGERPYTCDLCHVKFLQKGHLDVHMRSHTGEKPHSCDLCGVTCARKSSLTIHMRTHTGEKPHSCDVCHTKFSQKGSLNAHMRTHTGDKPYVCGQCQAKFAQKSSLNAHMTTHSGVKPHSCDVCQATFARKDQLRVHMTSHTGVKPHSCDLCQARFVQKAHLNAHMRTHWKKT
ncbi:zinc finger protein 239-like isoform X1 [Maniola hyperantus]|uniref:zinc finger protein 239-like isoform X1 n=1 Tax=Aphantopus hyperantus TaxID=2795564 RepID=UPI0015686246|nr:zinc finger protein 782-like [Maniola hyperantus]